MKAFIYVGGEIFPQNITEHPRSDDLTVAADGGYDNAVLLGERVDVIVGDLDSVRADVPKDIKVVKVPAEKDFSDLQLAISTAVEKGADEIAIIGGLSGRLDHTLANLALLKALSDSRIHAHINDGFNRVRYLSSSSTLVAKSHFRYLSILPISDKLRGVSIEGCKYPLKNATVEKNNSTLTVSNEIDGNCALISVRRGECYVIESAEVDSQTTTLK